jgi:hypothetical protein
LGEFERSEICGSFITNEAIRIKSKGERISNKAVEGGSGDARGKGIWEGPKELLVCCELERNNESCEEVEGVLDV